MESSGRTESTSVSTMEPTMRWGRSRSALWKWIMPTNLPVGDSRGGRHTKPMAARAGGTSALRDWARKVATVDSGGRMIGSVVIRPPAV